MEVVARRAGFEPWWSPVLAGGGGDGRWIWGELQNCSVVPAGMWRSVLLSINRLEL